MNEASSHVSGKSVDNIERHSLSFSLAKGLTRMYLSWSIRSYCVAESARFCRFGSLNAVQFKLDVQFDNVCSRLRMVYAEFVVHGLSREGPIRPSDIWVLSADSEHSKISRRLV